jgi:hypothetical protein
MPNILAPRRRSAHITVPPRVEATSAIRRWFSDVLSAIGAFTVEEVRNIADAAATLLARVIRVGEPIAVDVDYADQELSIRLSIAPRERHSPFGSHLILYRTPARSIADA